MKCVLSAALITAASILSPVTALAEPEPPKAKESRDAMERTESVVGGSGPIERAGGGSAFSSLQFASEEGEQIVKGSLTFQLNQIKPKYDEDSGTYRISTSKFTLTGEAPLEEGRDVPRIFKGDSLVSGSKIKASFNHFSNSVRDGRYSHGIEEEAQIRCVRNNMPAWIAEKSQALPQNESQIEQNAALSSKADVLISKLTDTNRTDTLRNIVVRERNNLPDILPFMDAKCFGTNDARELVKVHYPEKFDEHRRGYFLAGKSALFWGAEAAIGEDTYNALNRADFRIDEVDRTSWELGAFVGLIGDDLEWSIRGRAAYGKSYTLPDEDQECRTVTGATDPECIEGPDGLPKKEYTGVISIEGRKLFKLAQVGGDNKIGLAPQISYRFEDKDLNIEVPVYLSPDKDGKLSGGLKFAYSSKEDDFGIGLFVGIPFSVFFD